MAFMVRHKDNLFRIKMENILFNFGVATWVMDIITPVPTTAASKIFIGKTLPKNVGYIYGISTYLDGVDSQNIALPTTIQAQALYITLQNSSTQFMSEIRISDFANEELIAASFQVREKKYTPVSIPNFDLSQSYYQNPTGIVGPMNIRLKLWYIQENDWKRVQAGMLKMQQK